MSNRTVRRIVVTGITAAVYAVASLLLPFLTYSEIQCRFSEILNLLAFINPVFAPGIILGCFITNLFSPFPLDWLIGSFATASAMFFVVRSKSLLAASIWPTVFCIIIGAEITFYMGQPFLLSTFAITALTVMAGEFIAVTVVGVPLFKYLMRNKRLMKFLQDI